MDAELSERLLSDSGDKRIFKPRKIQQHRSGSALFFGCVMGFVFSFLFAYSGYLEENKGGFDYSSLDFSPLKSNKSEVVPDTNLAAFLEKEIRVFCLVMTTKEHLATSGKIIMDTWGKRCTKLIFFSQNKPDNIGLENIVLLKETDGFAKDREALKHVYMLYRSEFDWLVKTNDNSFIVLENLRHMLYQYDTQWPVLIGQLYLDQGYMKGIQVLSMKAFIKLLEEAFTNPEICEVKGNGEDIKLTKCLENVNVVKVDGIDQDGKGRFFGENPESILFPEKIDDSDKWYWNKLKRGINNCCSDRLIAIQNTVGTHFYYLEYFIYKVHAFGRHRKPEPLPEKLTLEDVLQKK